jgi:hypothetical protein
MVEDSTRKKSGRELGADLDRRGLRWIDDFGWLRPSELGSLLWPKQPTYRKSAEVLVRKWLKQGWILRRKLGDAGSAVVLTESGAARLNELSPNQVQSRAGTRWGNHQGGAAWSPPPAWRHELLQSSLLAWFRRHTHWEIVPERVLRRLGTGKNRVPDGLVFDHKVPVKREQTWWLEVENARKSGKAMQGMAEILIEIAHSQERSVCGDYVATAPMLAVVLGKKDDRGFQHAQALRAVEAIRRIADRDIRLMLAIIECDFVGAVRDVTYGWYTVPSSIVDRELELVEWETGDDGIRRGSWRHGVVLEIWKLTEPGTSGWGWAALLTHYNQRERREPEELATGTAKKAKEAKRAAYYGAIRTLPLSVIVPE